MTIFKNKMRKTIIMSVDTGIDDSLAMMFLLNNKDYNLKLITTCVGNTTVDNATYNSLNILQWFGRNDIVVAQGASKSLSGEMKRDSVHGGPTGMGEYVFPESTLKKSALSAVEEMHKICNKSEEKVVIICLSPLTNIAEFFQKYPSDIKKIEKIYFQGGFIGKSDYPTFNIEFDDKAVQILIDSKVPLVICPSNIGFINALDDEELKKIIKSNKTGEMYYKNFKSYSSNLNFSGKAMHDSSVVVCAIQQNICKIEKGYCKIERNLQNKVLFSIAVNQIESNCEVCTYMNKEKFKKFLYKNIRKCDKING